jgi:hypothetical protein
MTLARGREMEKYTSKVFETKEQVGQITVDLN